MHEFHNEYEEPDDEIEEIGTDPNDYHSFGYYGTCLTGVTKKEIPFIHKTGGGQLPLPKGRGLEGN